MLHPRRGHASATVAPTATVPRRDDGLPERPATLFSCRVRIFPNQKLSRLRVGAVRQATARRGDLIAAYLANSPQDDAIGARFLNLGTVRLKARHDDIS